MATWLGRGQRNVGIRGDRFKVVDRDSVSAVANLEGEEGSRAVKYVVGTIIGGR